MNLELPLFRFNSPSAFKAKAVGAPFLRKTQVKPEYSKFESALVLILKGMLATNGMLLTGALIFSPSLLLLVVLTVFFYGAKKIVDSIDSPVSYHLYTSLNLCAQYFTSTFSVIRRSLPVETPPPR